MWETEKHVQGGSKERSIIRTRKEGRMGLKRSEMSGSSWVLVLLVLCFFQHPELCYGLNEEGWTLMRIREMVEEDPFSSLVGWIMEAEEEEEDGDPCSWFGIGCQDGKVVSLNFGDLCLRGQLSSQVGSLIHLKYLNMHNNSFYGEIPREIGDLHKLEVLDLGFNNFVGSFLPDINNLLSLQLLVLSSNQLLDDLLLPAISGADIVSKIQVDDDNVANDQNIRRFLQESEETENGRKSKSRVYLPYFTPSKPAYAPPVSLSPPATAPSSLSPAVPPPNTPEPEASSQKTNHIVYISIGIAVGFLVIVAVCIILLKLFRKAATVNPCANGLSGQLQKAFVTGVPVLQRSELQVACEDFSNIIGSSAKFVLYKGTLSSGVEIAVSSSVAKSAKEWSDHSEAQFRNKIATLSKLNHKNLVNLLGYCEEDSTPFTRMIVFEYAPNGTLHDHFHAGIPQDLNWAARKRIAMGIAYCLDYMHGLNPPVVLKTLGSNSILLTDDCAAKISSGIDISETLGDGKLYHQGKKYNVYQYGMLLLQMISGRLLSYSEEEGGELLTWASDYLTGRKPMKDLIDPMLINTLGGGEEENHVTEIIGVVVDCVHSDPNKRPPSMRDVVARLREITQVNPERAAPKLSPLWWAELEIISTEAN